ncbi:disease resistance protein RPM1-like [Humulus lupulus]|uniref:disease resistance protein RPM1-like n=1 Tax=Humulus lupulus TaxID=3486 RepID=UPI002B4015F7|nr:disease resistance protein RPM1-like [Humulus lupulus]XP_062095835.1 disease resistance protein RPM1-like [Humulus lupulus]
MAESVVSFLLEKFSSLLEDEVKLLSGVRDEVVFVKNELDRIRAFLRSADAKEDQDEEIKVWVKQVREVAYDAEDTIDDFLYRFEHTKRHGFYGYLCKMARGIKNLKARRRIASQLQSIKLRVTDISEGRQRYGYKLSSTEIGSSSGTKPCYYSEVRSDARLLEEAQLVGIEPKKQALLSFLVKDTSQLRVAAVRGMGGLGKTTLVSSVYNDSRVKNHFHQIQAWVTVSQSFKLDEVLRQIIQQFFKATNLPLPDEVEKSTDTHFLKTTIVDFLSDKRYLVVLDDIWDVDAWEAVKVAFRNNNNGSRVMITTRTADVASTSTKDVGGHILTLNPLSSEDSWTLFYAKAFQGNACPTHLEEISRDILKRCEGLPLAIVAIGSMLATKDINRVDEWEIVHRSLRVELQGNTKLKGMQTILSLSFNDLPYHLKHCFMYLSLFPEDYSIKLNVLIRLWIAEGFIEGIEGRTLEEVANGCFNELLNRSLVQVNERYTDRRIKSCRVHDILRETMLLKSKDQGFAAITNKESSKRLPERVRRLSVHEGTNIDASGDKQLSQLRSLLLFTKEKDVWNNFMSSFSEQGSRLVKVLDCTRAPATTFPQSITKLYHLRYLCLRDTAVSSIPPSIANLRHLETLDLKRTLVRELPSEILRLQCLRHVIVYDFRILHGCKALKGMESLSSLRKLSCVEAKQDETEPMVTVGRLTQLTRLGILQLGAEHGDALFSSIRELKLLRSLTLVSRTEDEALSFQFKSFSSLQLLQRLYIRGPVEKSLEGLQNLTNLSTLYLSGSRLQVDPLESLQDLPNLVLLWFDERVYDGESLCFKAGSFLMLRELRISELENLRRVTVEDKALSHLKFMNLADCKLLEEIPSGIERLRNLQKLQLVNMAAELTTTVYRGSQHDNYSKVMHIPHVFIGRWSPESGTVGDWL